MMKNSIESVIADILEREGGYINHPADRGGPTNHGITQTTLSAYLGRPATIEDIQQLSAETAAQIILANYWIKPGFSDLPLANATQALLLDTCVNHGPTNAIRMLQRAALAVDDGVIGPKTRLAIAAMPNLTAGLLAERVAFYGRIITNNPSQAVFAAGWANRVAEFIRGLPA